MLKVLKLSYENQQLAWTWLFLFLCVWNGCTFVMYAFAGNVPSALVLLFFTFQTLWFAVLAYHEVKSARLHEIMNEPCC